LPLAVEMWHDTIQMNDAPVLNYGEKFKHGPIVCESEKTGMMCKNKSGQGFALSRAQQRLF
jgi:hypothetical protein